MTDICEKYAHVLFVNNKYYDLVKMWISRNLLLNCNITNVHF
jgi:hypothetical protein